MAMALLSLPITSHSQKSSFFQRPYSPTTFAPITFINYPSKPAIALFSSPSSSSSPSSTAEDEAQASPDAIAIQSESATIAVEEPPFRGCKACGREEVERGCNGEGRIQGGIATVPGFGWWPIKAYRPCPGFVASGGRYTRRGQSMDEVASGGGGRRVSPVGTSGEPDESSKKKQGPRKFKR